MKLIIKLLILIFPFLVLANNYFYYNGSLLFNFLLIIFESIVILFLIMLAKRFLFNKIMVFFLTVFFITTVIINNYWTPGALLNILVLLSYSFALINACLILNYEKTLGLFFFYSVFLILFFFLGYHFILTGFNSYKTLYSDISAANGIFHLLDSTLTIPLLVILFLFSSSYVTNNIYKIIIVLFCFTCLLFLQRRGPFLIALVFLILSIFKVESKFLYKTVLILPLVITLGVSIFIEEIQGLLSVIDLLERKGSSGSNDQRIGLYIHFLQDFKDFQILDYLKGHIDTFKNIVPDKKYQHPHNSLITLLFLSGILTVFFYIRIHFTLINQLIDKKLFIWARIILTFFLLSFTESLLNNFNFFSIMYMSLLYYFLVKLKFKQDVIIEIHQ